MRHAAKLALVITTVVLLAAGDAITSRAGDLNQNRLVFQQAKGDPARYARLRENLDAFRRLSPDRQEAVRRLDRELAKQEPAAQKRLIKTLERYRAWSDSLPEADRRRIETATDAYARLRAVKEIRARQWEESLPRAYRDQLARAAPAERAALLKKWRQDEKRRQQDWQTAFRHWQELSAGPPPARLADFPPAVRAFVTENLRPMLSREDEERLRKAEGRWPQYPATLVELADKHPYVLPGPLTGPARFRDLPAGLQKQLEKLGPGLLGGLREAEGKWPDYALAVAAVAKMHDITLPRSLGPSRPGDFPRQLGAFIRRRLEPALTSEEKSRLQMAEGHWPLYPRTVAELAASHHLYIPGPRVHLPGPRDYWDKYRPNNR
jgi:hypothetical protein